MKVSELRKALKALDQDALVIVRGYEGGFNDADAPAERMTDLDPNKKWYYGKYLDDAPNGSIKAYLL